LKVTNPPVKRANEHIIYTYQTYEKFDTVSDWLLWRRKRQTKLRWTDRTTAGKNSRVY